MLNYTYIVCLVYLFLNTKVRRDYEHIIYLFTQQAYKFKDVQSAIYIKTLRNVFKSRFRHLQGQLTSQGTHLHINSVSEVHKLNQLILI